ncbi:MAG: tail fiber domain-containing protein, partial [Verrucomicrobiae bacterium]|nr:tail fiber domain-containing protein [Verrucomicrobiae bacterium]
VGGTFACDNGQIYSDGSGNLTAQTFNPVSDRAHKENIKPFDPQTALTMALALTNYTWRFKGATNTLPAVTKQTNSVAPKGFTLVTNTVVKIRPATGKEIGPMAQEWKAATGLGSGTNISLTSFNGLLLGAVQGLNQKLADPTRPNGTLYPSNTWSMAAITNGMADGGFWTGNSNGQALVSVNLSNGVVRIKQLAP